VVLAASVAAVFFAPHAAERTTATLTASVTKAPARAAPDLSIAAGRTLFDENCSSCHGSDAQGSALAPNLRGVGSATVDLWVSSGWMPLAQPTISPTRKPVYFSRTQIKEIAYFVASLAKGGVPIPTVDLKGADVAEGFSVFALNCAPCHTITGSGDALANGISAPALHGVTATMVAEAVRTGPGNMPRFSSFTISAAQLRDVVAYVTGNIEQPDDPGGIGLGGVGPVAEGFVGLFAGVGLCVLCALWIGERNEREEDEGGHGSGHDLPAGPDPDESEPEVVHA
jgi:ubiquinol-cytochrome c reductase cytochrome c subunit